MDDIRAPIPAGAIAEGRISIYLDTPAEVENAVKRYNEHMLECGRRLKRAARFKDGILVLTPLVCAAIIAGSFLGLNSTVSLLWSDSFSVFVLLAVAAAYVYFGYFRDDIRAVVIASAALTCVQWYAVIIFAANALLYIIYRHITEELKAEKEYPAFNRIIIRYEKFNEPRGGEL